MKKYRRPAAVGVVASAIVCAWLTAVPASGQSRTAAASTFAGKTPWGDPDLQGIWTMWDPTPLQALGPTDPAVLAAAASDDRRKWVYQGKDYPYVGLGSGMGREHTSPVPARRQSLVVDPENGRIPVIPSAVRRSATLRELFDTWENHSVWGRCIAVGVPGRLLLGGALVEGDSTGYNKAYEIFQAPGYVVLFLEIMHEARVIPLDGRPHVGRDIDLWNGDSRGRWDGQTLVVETTNFNSRGDGKAGVPQTPALRVVERFTRVDEKTLQYETTLTDPNVYSRPWTARQIHSLDPQYVIFEYACHEGNWRNMEMTLGRGRLLDAEEVAKKGRQE